MKVVFSNQKGTVVRHWFRWYRVQRGFTDWHRLDYKKRPAPFSIKKTQEALKKAGYHK